MTQQEEEHSSSQFPLLLELPEDVLEVLFEYIRQQSLIHMLSVNKEVNQLITKYWTRHPPCEKYFWGSKWSELQSYLQTLCPLPNYIKMVVNLCVTREDIDQRFLNMMELLFAKETTLCIFEMDTLNKNESIWQELLARLVAKKLCLRISSSINTDLTPYVELENIVLQHCPCLTDLGKLVHVKHLVIDRCSNVDVSSIVRCQSLRTLTLQNFKELPCLSCLSNLSCLETLKIEACSADIFGLETLKTLKHLELAHTWKLSNLHFLKDLEELQVLKLYGCPDLCEFDGLCSVPEVYIQLCRHFDAQFSSHQQQQSKLVSLKIAMCSEVKDLTTLPSTVQRLTLSSCYNLCSLRGLRNVRELDCSSLNKNANVLSLADAVQLQFVRVSMSEIFWQWQPSGDGPLMKIHPGNQQFPQLERLEIVYVPNKVFETLSETDMEMMDVGWWARQIDVKVAGEDGNKHYRQVLDRQTQKKSWVRAFSK